jgi:hypothetical protein
VTILPWLSETDETRKKSCLSCVILSMAMIPRPKQTQATQDADATRCISHCQLGGMLGRPLGKEVRISVQPGLRGSCVALAFMQNPSLPSPIGLASIMAIFRNMAGNTFRLLSLATHVFRGIRSAHFDKG